MKRRTIFILFVLIFALALTLRLTGLVTESLWVDETYSISIATSHTVIADVITTEGTPFGYHYFLRYWIGLFGTSELSVRLPSVFFSLLSLVMIFLIGREIRDAKTGLIAATLFAVSLIDVVYAQEARIFALYGFLSLLMTYSTVKLVHLKSHFFAILYIISTILAFYVNYLAAPFVLLLTIYILWNNFSFRKWISLNFVIFVFCIPLFPIIQTQLATSMKGASARFVSIGLPLFLANLGTFIWLIPVLTIFFVASIFLLQKKKITLFLQKTPQWFYGGFLLIASFVLLYLIFNPLPTIGMRNPITHSFALIRHSLFFYPFLILFVSSIKLTSFKRIFYVCMGFFIMVNFIGLSVYFHEPTKPQWREAMGYIIENEVDPLILLDRGGKSSEFLANYYGEGRQLPLTWTPAKRKKASISDTNLFDRLTEVDRFWLLLSRNTNSYYKDLLDQRFMIIEERTFYGINLIHYEKDAST